MGERQAPQEGGAREEAGRGERLRLAVNDTAASGDGAVDGIDHVNITTPEELQDEVVQWYEEMLGLPRLEPPDDIVPPAVWFKAGAQQIHISIDPHNPPKEAHFGIVVDDFAAMVDRLRAGGCHIEQASEIPGRHRCYTRDPAGNRVEIVKYADDRIADVLYEEAGRRREGPVIG